MDPNKPQIDTLYQTYTRGLQKITPDMQSDSIMNMVGNTQAGNNNATMVSVPTDTIGSGATSATMNMTSGGVESGKASWSDVTSGFFLGIDTDGIAKFNIGNSTKYIQWNGTSFVITGAVSIGSLDIPDTVTANSFHVDSLGNAWWGAAAIGSATGKVLNTGAATFSNMTITGGSVAGSTITALSLTGGQMANATITATQIASATITGSNIAAATITGSNIALATIAAGNIVSGTITATQIASATITATQIANATITGTQIAAVTIAAGNIISNTITATQIANATITSTQISGTAGITGSQIASATIAAANIAANTITSSQIASATITATQIANLTITASQIANLTITSGKVNTALMSYSHNIVFSVGSDVQVNWASGTLTTSDGTSYSISAGNTGTMSAKNYIYLDTAVSATVLQKTTTFSTATGDGKMLIAVAQNNTTEAVFQVFNGIGGTNLSGNSIVANSITANEIAAATITGTQIAASTIVASNISVTSLSSLSANLGTITAGSISINGGVASIDTNGKAIFTNVQVGSYVLTISPGTDIQTSINTLSGLGGGTLFLQPGTYVVTSPITGASSIKIEGSSFSTTTIYFNIAANNGLAFAGTNVYTTGTITSISGGVNVVGSGTAWATHATAGQYMFLGTRWYKIGTVTNDTHIILAEGYGDSLTMPGLAYRVATIANAIEISEVTLTGSIGTALTFADARDIKLTYVILTGNYKGITMTNCSQISFDQVICTTNSSNGTELTNVGLCNFTEFATPANGGTGAVLSGCKTVPFVTCASDGNTLNGYSLTGCTDVYFQAEVSGNGGKGFELISGNDNVVISGLVTGNTSDGVKLTATSNNVKVYASKVTYNGGYGINIAASSDNFTNITTSNFASNVSGACQDLGTRTVIRGNTGLSDNANGNVTSISNTAEVNILANDAIYLKHDNLNAVSVDTTSSGTTSWSHTCAVTANCLIVTVSTQNVNSTTVTYGVQSMTLAKNTNDGFNNTSIFYLVNPATGAHTITVTVSGSSPVSGAVSLIGVNTSSPIGVTGGNSATTNALTTTVTSTIGNSILVDCIANWNNSGTSPTPTKGANQTSIFANAASSGGYAAAYRATTSVGSYSESYTNLGSTSPSQVMSVVEIVPVNNMGDYINKTSATTNTASDGFIGFATAAITAGNTGSVTIGGLVSGFSGLTTGSQYYLSDTAGLISTTPGTKTRKVGIALSATSLLITNVW